MFPAEFDYTAPATIDEAIRLLQQRDDAKILAGGHSLLPAMKLRLMTPAMLVDIGKIPELRGIEIDGSLRLGAMTTYRMVLDSQAACSRLPILVDSISKIGDKQVRNMGTVGGSLAHADPAADLTAVMLALDARLTARGPNGERTIAIDDFFVDMLMTALDPAELLTRIEIPLPQGRAGTAYAKFAHPASGYAVVGVAALLSLATDGTVQDCRIGVTGAGPKAQRARAAEDALRGQQPTADRLADAAQQAADGLDILGDIFASADYRANLVRVYTRRALEQAAARAG
ncbi:MAG: carbon monoxide dehydrogenase [Herpetosiphonaceae bacterium]|nr:MAG: carbon monoxide dehydrogenase [Herpetosiphonaceae bacterium]